MRQKNAQIKKNMKKWIFFERKLYFLKKSLWTPEMLLLFPEEIFPNGPDVYGSKSEER